MDATDYPSIYGNDTIDPYPLIPWRAAKISRITPASFKAISLAFSAFLDFIKRPVPQKAELIQSPKPRYEQPRIKRQRVYEPTNAIYVNECDYRRWCRVNEWFAQFTEFERRIFDPIKMDT